MPITYLKGDATKPVGDGKKIIVHVCNDIGAWGAGFVLALNKLDLGIRESYLNLFEDADEGTIPHLGDVQVVDVTPELAVANMIAQHGLGKDKEGTPAIRYWALKACLATVAMQADFQDASIHMPRIGCGLAGGTWEEVEKIINDTMNEIQVFVYDYEDENSSSFVKPRAEPEDPEDP